MSKHLLLFAFSLCVVLSGCKKEPKVVVVDGESYFLKLTRSTFTHDIKMYLRKGKTPQTTVESFTVMKDRHGHKLTKSLIPRVKKGYLATLRRFDRSIQFDKKMENFCFKRRLGKKRTIIHAYAFMKVGAFTMFQFTKEVPKDDFASTTKELCENSAEIFKELQELSKSYR